MTLTLTLDRVIWHTVMHHLSASIYTPHFIETGKNFLWIDVWMNVPTDGHFRPRIMLGGVDLQQLFSLCKVELVDVSGLCLAASCDMPIISHTM